MTRTSQKKVGFSLGERVIVTYPQTNKNVVGIITSKDVRNNRRVFDITSELGYKLFCVPVDAFDESIYINSYLSKKFAESIETNLTMTSLSNSYKKPKKQNGES